MFIDLNENKWQIMISSLLSMAYYYHTKEELNSIIIVTVSAVLLRYINIDNYIEGTNK